MKNNNNKQNYVFSTSQVAISFQLGKLKIFQFDTKALISEYKSSFGNFIALNYSPDGRLLGVGTESDEAFIIDSESNNFLYCLEGHKNYVSSIIFEEQLINDEEQFDSQEENNLLNCSIMETVLTEYNTNTGNTNLNGTGNISNTNNYLRLSTITNINHGFGANIGNYYKAPTRKIDSVELLQNLKEEADLQGKINHSDKFFDPKHLRKTRTYLPNININQTGNNNNNNNNNNSSECKECKIYDVYTAGYDGYLGIWRIEHYYDPDETGLIKNLTDMNFNTKDSNIVKKINYPRSILLSNNSEKIVFFTDLVKIQNIPIFYLDIFDNMLVLIGKRNNSGSSVNVKFFHGQIFTSEQMEKNQINQKPISEESYNQTNNSFNSKKKAYNVDSKYQELKQSSVNSTVNNSINTNANLTSTSYYEGKEREGKDTRDREKRGNSSVKNNGNSNNKNNNNKGAY